MDIDLILIGNELLIGQVVDTNSVWLGQELSKIGIRIHAKHTVPDQADDITRVLEESLKNVDGVIITGGLGPTNDDITKKVLADFFGAKTYKEDEQSLQIIRNLLSKRNIPLTDLNRAQASVPENCQVLLNRFGTAPGMLFTRAGKFVMSLPGVPWETKGIMKEQGIPWILNHFELPAAVHKTVFVQGVPESILAQMIAGWESDLPSYMTLAYLPSPGGVRLRISAIVPKQVSPQSELESLVDHKFELLKEIVGDAYLGLDYQNVEASIAHHLKLQKQTVATAESCTAGGVATALCSIPGASVYFKGSIVAYANNIKVQMLGVSEESLRAYGAVSMEVVMQMAQGVREKMDTDYGIATSGIAGPNGGTDEKPVGTVWIAIATRKACFSKKLTFGNDREHNTLRFISAALQELRSHLYYNSPSSEKLL